MKGALPGDIFHQGQILNNTYQIEGVLGRGGTGEVYRAQNLVSGRVVAIKALNAQFSGNEDYIELMKREEQMRDIRDDAVVRYTECSRSDQGHVFLVMDHVAGPSIADEMAMHRMESRALMIVAHRVAEGLVVAHKAGIVHRDLSPDNIILRDGDPGRATIIDFGIAKDTAAGARTIVGNDFAGKYEYAAPEQLEGRAEPRSDLYALGALLLAAFRGQVPFAGATPGEMIRRKQEPLDLSGVPEPLAGLIRWLSAPALADRAPSAAAVVARLQQQMAAQGGRGKTVQDKQGGRRGIWLAVPVVLALAAAGGYFAGLLDPILAPPLPVAEPYRLTAAAATAAAPATLAGNAPDAATATALADAFAAATGAPAKPEMLVLAQGMPSPGWPVAAASLFPALAPLEGWTLDLAGTSATVTGLAADATTRDEIAAGLQHLAADAGFALSLNLAAGPHLLAYDSVATALAEMADCGPLAQSGTAGEAYPLGATIDITGSVSDASRAAAIEADLQPRIGDRQLRTALTPLNPQVCAVREVLPVLPDTTLSIWFGQGATGEANLSGIFHKGDNPVVEILAPANLTDGRLWVAVVDNTGKVFNVVPNVYSEETALAALGVAADGVRRVPVLHALAELQAGRKVLAITVNDGDFGKSEIIAILSRRALFPTRRPSDESIASFVKALTEVQATDPDNIIGMASRLLEARP